MSKKALGHKMDANELKKRSSPLGCWNCAYDFFEAADIVRKKSEVEVRISLPAYYLYFHAIELTFKAFLGCKGIEVKALKNEFGHDLEKLLHKAEREGWTTHTQLTSQQTAVIKYTNQMYKEKYFEYYNQGVMNLPCLNEVHGTVKAILESLKSICENSVMQRLP